jgi:hypothetical protein
MAMPAKFTAGQMSELVAFDSRTEVNDGYGNLTAGPFKERLQRRAKFIFGKGGEAVFNGRLQGRATFIAVIYANDGTREIRPDWQMRDVRRGTVFNVRDVEEQPNRQTMEILVESNVNPG